MSRGRRASACKDGTGRRGFSLTEMLIIVVMLGILALMAFPKLDFMRYRVNSDVRSIMMTLAYAQRLAVSLQHNVQVTIDPVNRQIRTLEDKNDDGNYTTDERIRGFALSEGVVFDQNGAPNLPSPAASNVLTAVTFWRDGSANTAGVIFINTTRGVAKGHNKDSRALDIARSTGRATWYTFVSGSWKRGSS
jgi:prepilin-type N-terminal cleavage/methylation domain-containing protein